MQKPERQGQSIIKLTSNKHYYHFMTTLSDIDSLSRQDVGFHELWLNQIIVIKLC